MKLKPTPAAAEDGAETANFWIAAALTTILLLRPLWPPVSLAVKERIPETKSVAVNVPTPFVNVLLDGAKVAEVSPLATNDTVPP